MKPKAEDMARKRAAGKKTAKKRGQVAPAPKPAPKRPAKKAAGKKTGKPVAPVAPVAPVKPPAKNAAKKVAKKAARKKPAVKVAKKSGRPSPYREEFSAQVAKLCRLGATDKEIGEFFDVCEATVNNWKTDHPEFLESIKKGKSAADAEVADRLYKRATGYSHVDTKFASFEGKITDSVEYIKHFTPDTIACIFWLKNRRPDLWRDKVEVTGKDGGPMTIQLAPGMEAAIAAAAAHAAKVEAPAGEGEK